MTQTAPKSFQILLYKDISMCTGAQQHHPLALLAFKHKKHKVKASFCLVIGTNAKTVSDNNKGNL